MGLFSRRAKQNIFELAKTKADLLFNGEQQHYLVVPRSVLEQSPTLVDAVLQADAQLIHSLAKRNYYVRLRGEQSGKFISDPLFAYDKRNNNEGLGDGDQNSRPRSRSRRAAR